MERIKKHHKPDTLTPWKPWHLVIALDGSFQDELVIVEKSQEIMACIMRK